MFVSHVNFQAFGILEAYGALLTGVDGQAVVVDQ